MIERSYYLFLPFHKLGDDLYAEMEKNEKNFSKACLSYSENLEIAIAILKEVSKSLEGKNIDFFMGSTNLSMVAKDLDSKNACERLVKMNILSFDDFETDPNLWETFNKNKS